MRLDQYWTGKKIVFGVSSKRLSCLALSENPDLKKNSALNFWLHGYLKMKLQNLKLFEWVLRVPSYILHSPSGIISKHFPSFHDVLSSLPSSCSLDSSSSFPLQSLYLQFPQLFAWLVPSCPSGAHAASLDRPFLITHPKLPCKSP